MVGSDDRHTGKSAITTPQSASLTAPLTQGSPCRVPHRHRSPLPKQLNKFPICRFAASSDRHIRSFLLHIHMDIAVIDCVGVAHLRLLPDQGQGPGGSPATNAEVHGLAA